MTAVWPRCVSGRGPENRDIAAERAPPCCRTWQRNLLEHTYNVDAHHVPRSVHLDGPSDPAHVLSPLGVLTSLTYFDLEKEEEEQEEKMEVEEEQEEEEETVRVISHDRHNHHNHRQHQRGVEKKETMEMQEMKETK